MTTGIPASKHYCAPPTMTAMRPTHFELYSTRPEATVTFLGAVFGWKAEKWDGEEYWLLDTGEGPGINGAVAPAGNDGPRTLNTCEVPDLEKILGAVLANGGSLLGSVVEVPGVGRWAQVVGPGGEVIGLMEPISR